MVSMISNEQGIDWSRVFIPEGRTKKAVTHMIANERAKYGTPGKAKGKGSGTGSGSGSGSGTDATQTPKAVKTEAAAGDTPTATPGDTDSGKKRKRATKVKTEKDDQDEQAAPEDLEVKKIKTELEEVDAAIAEHYEQDANEEEQKDFVPGDEA